MKKKGTNCGIFNFFYKKVNAISCALISKDIGFI